METQACPFVSSPFVPVAIGFLGLGNGYFIWGGQALFRFSENSLAMAYRRFVDSSPQPVGWMAIAFLFLSILSVEIFRRAGDIPAMLILVGLTLIHATELPTRLLSSNPDGRRVGLFNLSLVSD